MTTLLATKQDVLGLKQDLHHVEERLTLQLANFDLRLQSLESRLVIRLSLVMAGLFSVSGTILALLR